MDCSCWALILTFAAETAFRIVDICQVILDGDSIKLAHFLTLATTDTSICTSLACSCALVLVNAHYHDAAALWAFLTELDDVAWTSLHTLTAAGTLLVVHLW